MRIRVKIANPLPPFTDAQGYVDIWATTLFAVALGMALGLMLLPAVLATIKG
jgi:hypothetical protein